MAQSISKLFICLILGAVLSFSQAPYHLWFLIFPVFSGFYYLYTKLESKRAVFFATFLFGIGYFVCGLNWIGNALLVEGNEYRWVWPLAVIALPCLLSFFTALFVTVAHVFSNKKSFLGFLSFCTMLCLSEFTRGYIFSGFPWNLYGYTWLGLMPIAQSASILGPYGLTFLTILWGASFGYLHIKKIRALLPVCVLALVFFTSLAYGLVRLETSEMTFNQNVQVKIVQPNIEQASKWKPEELANNFKKHLGLSQGEYSKKTVIVWPETAIPPTLLNSAAVAERFRSFLNEDVVLLSGGLYISSDRSNEKTLYHNSIFLLDGEAGPQRLYNKSHLVPFGEYIPFQDYIPLKPIVAFTGFQKGSGATTINLEGFPNPSPQICYEIIFPSRAVSKGDPRPNYILAVTNDAWYGNSAGPRQHFSIARFRAIEQGLPVVRSANTGISGLIGPYGRIIERLDLLTSGSITHDFPNPLINRTIYGRFGDLPFFLFAVSIVLFGFYKRKI